jgi:hypothetical protein
MATMLSGHAVAGAIPDSVVLLVCVLIGVVLWILPAPQRHLLESDGWTRRLARRLAAARVRHGISSPLTPTRYSNVEGANADADQAP